MLTDGPGDMIAYAFFDTPFGRAMTAWSGKGLCAAAFGTDDAALERELRSSLPEATFNRASATKAAFAATVFDPRATALALDIRGSAFQMEVWKALRAIPAGRTASYAEIARSIGKPSAARAVAAACAANRIAVAIPCHRVVRSDGSLSGYRWGTQVKEALLAYERATDSPLSTKERSHSRKSAISFAA